MSEHDPRRLARREYLRGGAILLSGPALILAGLLQPLSARGSTNSSEKITAEEFRRLLGQVARGWNQGDAAEAAAAFRADAVYVEPPNRQRYKGRHALFRFFGGGTSGPKRMVMAWHHIAFDSAAQVGFGEYSFALPDEGFQVHGVAVIAVRGGLIASWREYQVPSALSFDAFAGDSLVRP